MRKPALLAVVLGLALPAYGHAEDIVLKFWDNQQTESGLSQYQQEAVKSFEAANPGIKVEVTTIPYPEYQQRLLTAVQGGNAPDVSTVDQIWVAAFAEAGAIDPLDELAKAPASPPRPSSPAPGPRPTTTASSGASRSTSTSGSSASTTPTCSRRRAIDPATLATFEGLKAAGEKLTDAANGKFGIGLFAHKGEDTVVVMD